MMALEPKAPVPGHYNDLAGTLAECWRLLTRGAADRRSPMHTVSIATLGLDQQPKVRVVVLRGVEPIVRTFRFHTDRRSGKVREIAANDMVQMLAYDPVQKVQLRVTGRATAHFDDDVARDAWTRSQSQSRECYRQILAPGDAADDPSIAVRGGVEDGAANFVAVIVAIQSIEWLYLAHTGHRRALFSWRDGAAAATWLAP